MGRPCLKASASAISGDVTCSWYSLHAVKHTPLWSLITTPTLSAEKQKKSPHPH
jgi:uncharacterized protein YodC (DUF2158 family)